MFKETALMVVVCLGLIGKVRAADEDIFLNLYAQVPQQAIVPLSTETFAVAVLKGLTAADKALRVGDDKDKVSLYYRGRLQKSLYKPENRDDAKAWADLSGEIVDEALEKSPKAAQYDFELVDKMLTEAVKSLDEDSKYYPSFEDWKAERPKHQRYFAARMEGKVLYLKIVAVNQQTVAEVEKAVREFADAKGMVIDLRGSPGGMLGEAIKVVDLFSDEAIVISTKERDEESLTYYQAKDGDISGGKPIVVLIDGKTASAAEVMAAALQEQGRAKIVGTRSFGKGSIQNLIHLPSGGVLSLTNAYFYTPSGKKLHKQGVIPDVCTFEMPESKNIENLLQIGKDANCFSESREDSALELKTALKILEM